MVAEEAQAFIDQADDEDLNIKNLGKIKVTPDQISALNEIDELMKKAQRFETEYTKDKAPLPAPVFEQAMARIVDVMRIVDESEPKPFEEKKVKKVEMKVEKKEVDESIIEKDECSKYKGGEFSKYEKGLKG